MMRWPDMRPAHQDEVMAWGDSFDSFAPCFLLVMLLWFWITRFSSWQLISCRIRCVTLRSFGGNLIAPPQIHGADGSFKNEQKAVTWAHSKCTTSTKPTAQSVLLCAWKHTCRIPLYAYAWETENDWVRETGSNGEFVNSASSVGGAGDLGSFPDQGHVA